MQGPVQQARLKKAFTSLTQPGLSWMTGGCGEARGGLAAGSGTGRRAYVLWDPPAQAVPASPPWGAEHAWEASMHVDYLLFDIFPLMILS